MIIDQVMRRLLTAVKDVQITQRWRRHTGHTVDVIDVLCQRGMPPVGVYDEQIKALPHMLHQFYGFSGVRHHRFGWQTPRFGFYDEVRAECGKVPVRVSVIRTP